MSTMTISELCNEIRALTHDDLIDGVNVQIADAIQAAPRANAVIEKRLVDVRQWVESADVAARDAERAATSARSDLGRAIRILEGLRDE